MRIEHIALWTHDLERSREFYTGFFGGTAGKKYHNMKTGFQSYFISFETGSRLELMTAPDVTDAARGTDRLTGYAHLAFSVGTETAVSSLTEALRTEGYVVISEPRTTGDGYYESCVLDPDGNPVEITL